MTSFENTKKIAIITIMHTTIVSISAVSVGIGFAIHIFSAVIFTEARREFCGTFDEFFMGLCIAMVSDAIRMVEQSFVLMGAGIAGVIASTLYFRFKINSLKETS